MTRPGPLLYEDPDLEVLKINKEENSLGHLQTLANSFSSCSQILLLNSI